MRIGIYNRWLPTLGGGERETAALAAALQSEHSVDLLTHQRMDPKLVSRRLHIGLDNVRLRALPLDPDYEVVAAASADYDLFVNMSHGDFFIPRARRNLLRVFFPARVEDNASDDVDGHVSPRHAAGGTRVRLVSGFHEPERGLGNAGSFAWTGPRAAMIVEQEVVQIRGNKRMPQTAALVLRAWRPAGARPATVRVLVDDRVLITCSLPTDGRPQRLLIRLPEGHTRAGSVLLTLEATTFVPRDTGAGEDYRELGVVVEGVQLLDDSWLARWKLRGNTGVAPDADAHAAMLTQRILPSVRTYDLLLANSVYTQEWITRRWGLSSRVLYPPVQVDDFPARPKRRLILSVGRFFTGSHNKKHLPMIAAFRELCDRGLRGWEYHLAGGCDETMPEQRAYLEQVRDAARGYPIAIHANIAFDALRALYREAAIFWHATGLGEDDERAPESFEHFGITTVEAMAAGCVPVVIGKAGQLEIVEHGVNGLLWQTIAELQTHTRALIEDNVLRARLSMAAHQRSRDFDEARFEREVRALVEEAAIARPSRDQS